MRDVTLETFAEYACYPPSHLRSIKWLNRYSVKTLEHLPFNRFCVWNSFLNFIEFCPVTSRRVYKYFFVLKSILMLRKVIMQVSKYVVLLIQRVYTKIYLYSTRCTILVRHRIMWVEAKRFSTLFPIMLIARNSKSDYIRTAQRDQDIKSIT